MVPTVNPAAKIMMPIYTVPTPTDKAARIASTPYKFKSSRQLQALVLAEMLMVLVIVALFFSMAMLNITGLVDKSRFKNQAQEFIYMMRMAVTAATETGKRYEVILDVAEQTYTLRQITSSDLSEILDDDIIQTGNFTENCQLSYVQFDDLWQTNEDFEVAFFRAGPSGWQAGGKIVMLDSGGQEYTIIVNRLNGIIEIKKGNIELLMPQDNVLF
jgi:Tfp pilus assembly protein FimT